MPNLLHEIKISLNKLETAPRKKMGQNFMISEETLRFIADALNAQKGETVLEIGPGLGALTGPLLEAGAEVWAVEKDARFVEILNQATGDTKNDTPTYSKVFVTLDSPRSVEAVSKALEAKGFQVSSLQKEVEAVSFFDLHIF